MKNNNNRPTATLLYAAPNILNKKRRPFGRTDRVYAGPEISDEDEAARDAEPKEYPRNYERDTDENGEPLMEAVYSAPDMPENDEPTMRAVYAAPRRGRKPFGGTMRAVYAAPGFFGIKEQEAELKEVYGCPEFFDKKAKDNDAIVQGVYAAPESGLGLGAGWTQMPENMDFGHVDPGQYVDRIPESNIPKGMRLCPGCRTLVGMNDRFCRECGRKLPEAGKKPLYNGERPEFV